MPVVEPLMAVVHVTAPPEIDPSVIEAELARALGRHRALPMTAEVTRAAEVRSGPARRPRSHGFVLALSLVDEVPSRKVAKRVQKATQKALRRRLGPGVSTQVDTELSPAEQAAYWCTLRGTPHRQY